jgi:hypothetical protein
MGRRLRMRWWEGRLTSKQGGDGEAHIECCMYMYRVVLVNKEMCIKVVIVRLKNLG